MADLNCGVYSIVNLTNQKRYIGSSNNFVRRKHDHFKMLGLGIHYNQHLQRAFEKYGGNAFEFKTLIVCESWELLRYEQAMIDLLNPEYNVSRTAGGGTVPEQFTPEVRAKMSRSVSLAQTGQKRGPHSESHKQALSQSLSGHSLSDATKEKIRNAHIGQTHKGNRGFRQTPETRQKISESMKRFRASQRSSNGN